MNLITFDIETIPNNRAQEYFTKYKKYKAPSNYKDADKINSYIEESRAEDIKRAGLYWWTGEIIAICTHNIVNKKTTYYCTKEFDTIECVKFCKDEVELLQQLMNDLSDRTYTLIGKNCKTFDKPFIAGRLLHHNIGFIDLFRRGYITDVDEIFSNSSYCSQITNLDAYAFGMNITGKEFDGSQVHELYLQGKHQELARYCIHDVEVVSEMVRRYYKQWKK